MKTKHCPACQQSKPASEFYPAPSAKSGLDSCCKLCNLARNRARYAANPAAAQAVRRAGRLRRALRKLNL